MFLTSAILKDNTKAYYERKLEAVIAEKEQAAKDAAAHIERTEHDLKRHYKEKYSDVVPKQDVEKMLVNAARDNTRKVVASEYKGRTFNIFEEIRDPYPAQWPGSSDRTGIYYGERLADEIELVEAMYIGGDLYIVPLQVYRSENPALLKVVFLVSDIGYSERLGGTYAEIWQNNIRTAYMTLDRVLYYHSGAGDAGGGEWDMKPDPDKVFYE